MFNSNSNIPDNILISIQHLYGIKVCDCYIPADSDPLDISSYTFILQNIRDMSFISYDPEPCYSKYYDKIYMNVKKIESINNESHRFLCSFKYSDSNILDKHVVVDISEDDYKRNSIKENFLLAFINGIQRFSAVIDEDYIE